MTCVLVLFRKVFLRPKGLGGTYFSFAMTFLFFPMLHRFGQNAWLKAETLHHLQHVRTYLLWFCNSLLPCYQWFDLHFLLCLGIILQKFNLQISVALWFCLSLDFSEQQNLITWLQLFILNINNRTKLLWWLKECLLTCSLESSQPSSCLINCYTLQVQPLLNKK